jgi:CSLREA domain-containing protein
MENNRSPILSGEFFHARRLRFETLEDRRLLATVNTLIDVNNAGDGLTTLREAIVAATAGETINFSVTGTINLNQGNGELLINKSLTINGPGSNLLTIHAGHGTDGLPNTSDGIRVFRIESTGGMNATLRDLTISGGDVAGSGGGVFIAEAATLDRVVITANAASADGGGVFHQSDDITIVRSTLNGNVAGDEGGGLRQNGGSASISDSTFSNNTAFRGGGIRKGNGGTLQVTNSTISGNSANSVGGGLDLASGGAIRHSTITNNTADANNDGTGQGGGLYATGSAPTVNHTIIAGNQTKTNNTGPAPEVAGTISATFSLIGGNALLAPLADNGGPTRTHALLPGSPAFNSGNPSFNPNTFNPPLIYDQRGAGFDRVLNGRIDIGAFEAAAGTFVVDTFMDESDGNFSAGDFSLREAISLANGAAGVNLIAFAPALDGRTILLSLGELVISEAVTIDASSLVTGLTINANQVSRVFNITATTGNFVLNHLTITGGKTTAAGANGGAIRSLTSGSLSLIASTVTGNITNGDFAQGGGIFASGPVMLTDGILTDNLTTGLGGYGGGVATFGMVSLSRSSVGGNVTAGYGAVGGGVFAGGVTISESTVNGNSTLGDAAHGAGIFSTGNITLRDSAVSGNSTSGEDADGGGIYTSTGVVTLIQSTVSGNDTFGDDSDGAGISGSNVTLILSTVTDNRAMTASSIAGGVRVTNDLIVDGSIIAGNLAGAGNPDVQQGIGQLEVNYSLIGNTSGTAIHAGTGAGNRLNVDPMLGQLEDNGGLTFTHALLPGSPAIDVGDPNFDPDAFIPPVTYDQRGADFERIENGRIDMGSTESAPVDLIVDTLLDESDGNHSPGDLSLREAVMIANNRPQNDIIAFDPALFSTAQTMNLNLGAIQISDDLIIQGPGQERLTIDAQQLSRIFNITATTGDFTIEGLTLTRGRTVLDNQPAVDTHSGGAIRSLSNGTLTLIDCTVRDSSTGGTDANGGGIFASAGDVTLIRTTVSGNSAAGTNASGGAVFTYGDVTITDSTISGNSTAGANGLGGGLVGGNVTLTRSTVSGNSTSGTGAVGGGILGGNVTLIQSTVSGNSTSGGSADGGGIIAGAVTIRYSTVTGNRALAASSAGGGIWIDFGPNTIRGSIIAGNTAGSASPDLRLAGATTITHSLIGNNQGTSLIEAQTPDANGNLIGSSTGGGIVNPMLADLADNGGPTLTHAPLSGSPAIDRGDPTFNPNDPDGNPMSDDAMPFDQRGEPFVRVFDGDGAGGARIDMGALELQPVGPELRGDYNRDEIVDVADFVMWSKLSVLTEVPAYSGADGNGDTRVDNDDYDVWAEHFGETLPSGAGGEASLASGQSDVGSGESEDSSIESRGQDFSSLELSAASNGYETVPSQLSRSENPGLADWIETSYVAPRSAMDRRSVTKPHLAAPDERGATIREDALVAWLSLRQPFYRGENSDAIDWCGDDSEEIRFEGSDYAFEAILVAWEADEF